MSLARTRSIAVAAAAAALIASPAAAVDGVLEINAACAAAGCFPGDPPGFPVVLTVAGSYRLTGDLDVPDENTTAIRAQAEVTIDLNGFGIRGVTSCTSSTTAPQTVTCSPTGNGIGVDSENLSIPVEVYGGTIAGMGDIAIRAGSHSRLHDLRIADNGGGGIEVLLGGVLVRGVVVHENGGTGISLAGGSIRASVVSDSVVSNSGGDGVDCGTCVIRDSQFLLNAGNGMNVNGGVIRGSSARNNNGFGLRSIAAAGYAENSFLGNGGAGPNPEVSAGAVQLGANACGSNLCP